MASQGSLLPTARAALRQTAEAPYHPHSPRLPLHSALRIEHRAEDESPMAEYSPLHCVGTEQSLGQRGVLRQSLR